MQQPELSGESERHSSPSSPKDRSSKQHAEVPTHVGVLFVFATLILAFTCVAIVVKHRQFQHARQQIETFYEVG